MADDEAGVLQRWRVMARRWDDLWRIAGFFGGATALGLAGALAYGACFTDCWLGGVGLWSMALFACGGGVGFLFGIPKVVQTAPATAALSAGPPPAERTADDDGTTGSAFTYQQRVNTNLEEISDWLTKIIVGLGLVQLNTLPDRVWRLSTLITTSLGKDVPPGFGTGLILFFTVVGFLFGYLITRLYLQGALARAERLIELEGKAGAIELKKQSKAATNQVAAAVQATAAAPPVAGRAAPSAEDQLRALADAYLKVNIPDWQARVRVKDELTAQMAAFIVRGEVARDTLVAETHEGLLVALAAAIHFQPEAGDLQRLLTASPNAHRLHVRYRFVMAFSCLLDRGPVDPAQRGEIARVLNTFEVGADDSLRLAIAGLRKQLGTIV